MGRLAKVIKYQRDEGVYGEAAITSLKYDGWGNITAITDPNGNDAGPDWRYTTKYEYDPLGRNTAIIYPDESGSPSDFPKMTMDFDYTTNILTIKDENNHVTTQYQDMQGRVIREVTTDDLSNRTVYDYDKYNRLVQVIDAKNQHTYYRYDRSGNLTQKIDAKGHVTRYKYDELNRLLEECDPEGYLTTYRYDAIGNLEMVQDPNGTIKQYDYYPNNLVSDISLSNGSNVSSIEYWYDEAGYLLKAVDGNVTTEYNTYGSVYRPNPFGRINKLTRRIDGQVFDVEYAYDVMGRVTGIKDPSGDWVNYEYNQLGQLTSMPGYINEAPQYDNGGMLTGITAANGISTSYTYDANGRLTDLDYTQQAEILKEYNLTYDNANNITDKNDNQYTYDELNQLLTADLKGKFECDPSVGAQDVGRTLSDYTGQSSLMRLASQTEIIELDYAAGSIGVDLQKPVLISRVELTPQSPVHRVKASNLAVYYSMDNISYTKIEDWELETGYLGELKILFNTPVTGQYVKVQSNFDERYKEDFEPEEGKAEFINLANEIIQVFYYEGKRYEAHSYDEVGNRLTETIVLGESNNAIRSYSYYENSNPLKENDRYAFEYDANGNLIKKGSSYTINGDTITFNSDGGEYWEYEYDLQNRLTKVVKNGNLVAEYAYDHSGLRLKKNSAGHNTYYVFGLNGEVLYEQEDRGYMEYIYVLGQHFARVDGTLDSAERTKYFYHTDHLGSTILVTDTAGQIVWSAEYTPFGIVTVEEGSLRKAGKFTGKDLDEDTGLYYYNARWYDQEIGRFISEDSYLGELKYPQNQNLYLYTVNNPMKYIDLTGHHYVGGLKINYPEDWDPESYNLENSVRNYYQNYKESSEWNEVVIDWQQQLNNLVEEKASEKNREEWLHYTSSN